MKQYRNYIFDLYGTLVDIRTDESAHSLWEHMSLFYGYYGAHYEADELHQAYLKLVHDKEKALEKEESVRYAHEAYPEIPLEEVFRELYELQGVAPDSPLVLHTGQMFRALSTKYIRLYAHVKELLRALKESDRGVYLLSNAQRIFTEYELHYLGIYDLFDGILISSEEGCKKPDKRFFEILLNRYHLAASECLMIGNDMATDIEGAMNAGMDSFYIRSAISPREQKASHIHADYGMDKMNLRVLKDRLLATQH